jgi:hypothetical protein
MYEIEPANSEIQKQAESMQKKDMTEEVVYVHMLRKVETRRLNVGNGK